MWIRVCPFCKRRTDRDFMRILKIKKVSVLHYKNDRYQLEFKNNNDEEICCENCAKTHTIKELWDKLEYHNKQNVEPPDE